MNESPDKQPPLITVITVSYNSSKTIEHTIQSVLSQNFKDWEYLVIDGASTDGTLDILKRYQNNPRLRIYSEKDSGIYDAMNKGVRLANGHFLHFLNADDFLASENVYTCIELALRESLATSESKLIHGKIKYRHTDGRVRELGYPTQDCELRFELKGIYQPATFFPKQAFQAHGYFDLSYKIAADYEIIRRFHAKIGSHFIDETLVIMSEGGVSTTQVKKACLENRKIALMYGESALETYLHELKVRIGSFLRYKTPALFHFFLGMKAKLKS